MRVKVSAAQGRLKLLCTSVFGDEKRTAFYSVLGAEGHGSNVRMDSYYSK
jgi:hypothetical protein